MGLLPRAACLKRDRLSASLQALLFDRLGKHAKLIQQDQPPVEVLSAMKADEGSLRRTRIWATPQGSGNSATAGYGRSCSHGRSSRWDSLSVSQKRRELAVNAPS